MEELNGVNNFPQNKKAVFGKALYFPRRKLFILKNNFSHLWYDVSFTLQ